MSAKNIEISSVGAKVKYAFESTAGVRPTSGYKTVPGIVSAPDFNLTYDFEEVSAIDDVTKRYKAGQGDPGSDKTFTANHNEATIETWENLVQTAKVNLASGKRCWFEYSFPEATKSFFAALQPLSCGAPGIDKGTVVGKINLPAAMLEFGGWKTKSSQISASPTTASIAPEATASVTLSNVAGTAVAESTIPTVATVNGSGTAWTITGVSVGSCVVTFKDDNGDEADVLVTVTSST